MFEHREPPFEETPPFEEVPPFDLEECGPEELDALAGLDDPDGCDGYGLQPDRALEAAGWDALTELEESLERGRLEGLDADGILAEASAAKATERRAQVRQVWLATQWADRHAVLARPWMTTPGCERLVRLGGAGTPEVAEFAAAELGAVIGMTDNAAKSLMADALDLRHRFPLLSAAVQARFVDVWVARKTVQQARALSKEAAARVDARIAGIAGTLSWTRLRKIVEKEILAADPPKAMDDADRAAAESGVFVNPEAVDGFQDMMIKARAGDVQALDKTLDQISRALKTLGDPRPPRQRRAIAVGIIANPQTALDLLAKAEQVRKTQRDAAAARRAGNQQAADDLAATLPDGVHPDGRCGNQRPFTFKTAVLYYHLTRDALDRILAGEPFAGASVGRVEDLGPLILDQIKAWLQHANLVLKPVIDLNDIAPVDHYEAPDRISEAVGLVRCTDSFPYGTSTSRHQDNEHTIPYLPMNRGGPPGQTDPLKMSKMTRFHHRLKTHGGWTVQQLRIGAWLYRSPHRYYFLVDQHGTTPLGRV